MRCESGNPKSRLDCRPTADVLKSTKINIVLQVKNGYPSTFGVDPGGRCAAFFNQGIYLIPFVDQNSDTSATSSLHVSREREKLLDWEERFFARNAMEGALATFLDMGITLFGSEFVAAAR